MADTSNLSNFLTDVANAIRNKKETTEQIPAANFDTEIESIETGIDTSDATALANDIINPKTAYVNGEKITGTIVPTYEQIASEEYSVIDASNILASSEYYAVSPDGKIIVGNTSDIDFNIYLLNSATNMYELKGRVTNSNHKNYFINVSNLGYNGNPDLFLIWRNDDDSVSRTPGSYWLYNIKTNTFITKMLSAPDNYVIHKWESTMLFDDYYPMIAVRVTERGNTSNNQILINLPYSISDDRSALQTISNRCG